MSGPTTPPSRAATSTPATADRNVPPVATGLGNMADPHTEPSLTAATVTVGKGAHLVIEQIHTGCCFAEGSISYLVIRHVDGTLVTWREFDAGGEGKAQVGLDVTLAPGTFRLESFQRPCDANCGFLDPAVMKCSRQISLSSGQVVRIMVRWAVRDTQCSFSG